MAKLPYDGNEAFKTCRDVWFKMQGPAAAQKALDQHEMTRDLRQFPFEHCFAAVRTRPGLEGGHTQHTTP